MPSSGERYWSQHRGECVSLEVNAWRGSKLHCLAVTGKIESVWVILPDDPAVSFSSAVSSDTSQLMG